MIGGKLSAFRLLTWTSFNVQFIHAGGGGGRWCKGDIVIVHFIRVHDDLV